MDRSKYGNKSHNSFGNILYWAVGTLIMLTVISTLMLSNLFAKYIVTDSSSNSANVAAGGEMLLLEHKATLVSGVYVLSEDEADLVTTNNYDKVIPGVDIPKDPFVRLNLEASEVDYKLYVKVIKSENFPETVTFKLTDKWLPYNEAKGIYVYDGYFDAGTSDIDDIPILKNNKLYVGDHYVGTDDNDVPQSFSLTFEAMLKQVD